MIYLIASPSRRVIEEEIRKIVGENEYRTMYLNQISLEDILVDVLYPQMFEQTRYLIIHNADLFGSEKVQEATLNTLQNYLNNPSPNTNIIFTTMNKIDLRKKIVKIIKDNYNLININQYDRKELKEKIEVILNKNNYKIDYDTIQYVIDNSFNNYDIICNELEKIMLFYNEACKVEYEDVKKIIGRSIEDNNFKFVNLVIDKRLKEAYELFQNLKINKVEPLSLIILLAREYRLMFNIKRYYNKKMDYKEIARNLNLQNWQLEKLYNNSLKYTESELLSNLCFLSKLDVGIKNGKYDKDIALMSFLLEACF